MTNDFMPFVVLRATKPADLTNKKTRPVKVIVDRSFLDSLGLLDSDKEKVYKNAQQYLEKNKLEFYLDTLPIPLKSFIDWYDVQNKPLKNTELLGSIEHILKNEITTLVTSNEFMQSKERVIRDLIISSIVDIDVEYLRPLITRAFKFIAALETLSTLQSDNPSGDFETLLQRLILLPKEIFPVNFESAKLIKEKRELATRKANLLAEQKKKINEKAELLNLYKKAIYELTDSFDIHVNRLNEKSVESANPTARSTRTSNEVSKLLYNKLNKEIIEKLSTETKDVLKKESFELDSVNVPIAVNRLENTLVKLHNEIVDTKSSFIYSYLSIPSQGLPVPVPGPCPSTNEPEVSIPIEDFPPKKGNGFVHNFYIGDLQRVRQTLKRYELGEIAAIENVMIGETKISKYRQLQKVEESITTETETVQDSEKELQTNEQFQLQTQSAKTIAEDKSKEAGLTVTASYGPVTATATGNIAAHNASEESRNASSNYARDIINRSVQKIKERVFKQTMRKTTSETERNQEHSFENKTGTEHINGVYQWVNKIYEVQVVNYGLRQFLEFIIPDPAGFYRFAVQNKPLEGITLQKPEKPGYCDHNTFRPLEAKDLNEYSYSYWAAKLDVPDISPPPPRFKNISWGKIFNSEESEGIPRVTTTSEAAINIPKGYYLKSGKYSLDWGRASSSGTEWNDELYFSFFIANKEIIKFIKNENMPSIPGMDSSKVTDTKGDVTIVFEDMPYLFSDNIDSSLPISMACFSTITLSLNFGISILCERTKENFEQWQIDTLNKIMSTYNDSLERYNREVENKQFNVFTSIQGRNPFINREVEKTELKKQCLSQFTGQDYSGFHLMMETDPITGYPQQNYENTYLGGKYIQFFENAFEWQNMTYVFYDYYWSNKKDWSSILSLKDIDPLFEKFLKSGAARVQVPVRPGFESLILKFKVLGVGESLIGSDGGLLIAEREETIPFISMLDEIKVQMNVDFEKRDGTISVQEGSVNVIGSATNFRAIREDWHDDDIDREIIINTKRYRIASVEDALNITLRQPFHKGKAEETTENISYYMGGKFVGEPWEILVPSELVFLTKENLIKQS